MRPAGRTRSASVSPESGSVAPAHPPEEHRPKVLQTNEIPAMRDSDANLTLIWRGLTASWWSAAIAACHPRHWMALGEFDLATLRKTRYPRWGEREVGSLSFPAAPQRQ